MLALEANDCAAAASLVAPLLLAQEWGRRLAAVADIATALPVACNTSAAPAVHRWDSAGLSSDDRDGCKHCNALASCRNAMKAVNCNQ